ncbi:MAG: c-type cytochrome [Novosphingobium sp.]
MLKALGKGVVAVLVLVTATTATTALDARKLRPQAAAAIKRGQVLATARCGVCHGVTANAPSPNAEAPPWDDIANRPGTTHVTLRAFLRDSHNYPEAMNFRIKPAQVDDIARYMITLQRKGYKPSI